MPPIVQLDGILKRGPHRVKDPMVHAFGLHLRITCPRFKLLQGTQHMDGLQDDHTVQVELYDGHHIIPAIVQCEDMPVG